MLKIGIQLAGAIDALEGVQNRLDAQTVFFGHVVRPRLLEALGEAYHGSRHRCQNRTVISILHFSHS